jgi:hypothetical protein
MMRLPSYVRTLQDRNDLGYWGQTVALIQVFFGTLPDFMEQGEMLSSARLG